ncbi:lipoprotein-anchoring transpeptidase ErfK/SrfK [Mumia flava]|uniref:Lipoprotein-anchoring transpeptidase ErfK/SrfK n=1 Tax=Mumia flava TaxID=1348852 RepID=A0A2M9BFD5_9ACTN|nr:lipoprotein-anchoring transpeptidase ErfK/SrfK [Mumia flava]
MLLGALLAAGVQATSATERITAWAPIGAPAAEEGAVAAGAEPVTRSDESAGPSTGETGLASPPPTTAAPSDAPPPEAQTVPLDRPRTTKRGELLAPNVAPPVPARSGTGRRVVFSMSEQRVWIVGSGGRAQRTYLVSGSRYDNLQPGRYEIYSRSRHATSFTLSSTMEFFVRFTRGPNAAIGFHSIPVSNDGTLVQTTQQLGTELSAGCIRQRRSDAKALWQFAGVGTRVVVVG